MPFIYKGEIPGGTNQGRNIVGNPEMTTLADSTTFTVGDAVKFDGTNGVLVLWGAGGAGAGIIVGFKNADGSPVVLDGAGGDFVDTYTTGASNTVYAEVDFSKQSLYSVALDDTIGTTTGSDVAGVNFDLVAASDQLDEDSVQAAGTTASFFSFGEDPDSKAPANSVLVKIQESQLDI